MEYSVIASIVFHLLFLYWHMEKVNLVFWQRKSNIFLGFSVAQLFL